MGFSNPIIGGAATLIRAAMQSVNFVTGVSGWQITKTGNAEFNSLTFRGTFAGTNFILSTAGMFFYSGTPAAGNLSFSITPAATNNDSFGNVVPNTGATAYTFGSGFWSALNMGSGVLTWFKSTTQAGPWINEAGIGFSWNNLTGGGLIFSAPAGIGGSFTIPQATPPDWPLSHTGTDNNSGSTFVSGERAQMNNLWSVPINQLIDTVNDLISQLQSAGVLD